jgi:hypothetical protein
MSSSKSYYCSALVTAHLLFLAAFLATISTALATNITYNFVNYPVNQADAINPGTVTISGTNTHLVGGSISYFMSGGSATGVPFDKAEGGILYATSTELTCPTGFGTAFFYDPGPSYPVVELAYDRYSTPNLYYGGIEFPMGTMISEFYSSGPTSVSGSIGANDPWIIATAVPEPGVLILLGSAMLGLGWVRLVRRRTAKM